MGRILASKKSGEDAGTPWADARAGINRTGTTKIDDRIRSSAQAYSAKVATIRFGSSLQTVPFPSFANQTEPEPDASQPPPSPQNCCSTLSVCGLIRVSGKPGAVTQMEPSPKAILPAAEGMLRSIVEATLLDLGSTFATLPSVLHKTHADPSPKVIAIGCAAVSIRLSTRLVFGSMRS